MDTDRTDQPDDQPAADGTSEKDTIGVINRYFAAMRQGASAESDMLALFCDDAVYSEPFSGQEPAHGLAAIRQRLRDGWEEPLPDMELDVLEVEVSSGSARSRWECRSPALPGPVQGEDRYLFEGGRISRLEVSFLTGQG